MRRRASALVRIMLAALLGTGATAGAHAQSTDAPQQFFGTPGGWAFDPERPATSTLLTSPEEGGFLLFFCEAAHPAFFLALGTSEARETDAWHDGLLQVYPAAEKGSDFLLAQFAVRLLAPGAIRSPRLVSSFGAPPRRLIDLVRNYPTGIRLTITPLRHDSFTTSRTIDLFLPGTADEPDLPMELAIVSLLEACRRQSMR